MAMHLKIHRKEKESLKTTTKRIKDNFLYLQLAKQLK